MSLSQLIKVDLKGEVLLVYNWGLELRRFWRSLFEISNGCSVPALSIGAWWGCYAFVVAILVGEMQPKLPGFPYFLKRSIKWCLVEIVAYEIMPYNYLMLESRHWKVSFKKMNTFFDLHTAMTKKISVSAWRLLTPFYFYPIVAFYPG